MSKSRLGFNIVIVAFHFLLCFPCLSRAWISSNAEEIRFYLFPNPSNPKYREEIVRGNVTSLLRSSFKPNFLTVFVTHGFVTDISYLKPITNAYLASRIQANIIAVDWGPLSGHPPFWVDIFHLYNTASANVSIVALRIGSFIRWLMKQNVISADALHLIGHSLGAHIMGEVGKYLQSMWRGYKIPRITGLDPAGPNFSPLKEGRGLMKNNAKFVDIIHTDSRYGNTGKAGHVDFFVNPRDPTQPGCNIFSDFFFGCSHGFSIHLYAASLTKRFLACPCSSQDFRNQPTSSTCLSPVVVGAYCPENVTGTYYLQIQGPLRSLRIQ